jgi:hypothetical protein
MIRLHRCSEVLDELRLVALTARQKGWGCGCYGASEYLDDIVPVLMADNRASVPDGRWVHLGVEGCGYPVNCDCDYDDRDPSRPSRRPRTKALIDRDVDTWNHEMLLGPDYISGDGWCEHFHVARRQDHVEVLE